MDPRGVVRLGANAADVEALLGIHDRAATRVEVSLGRGWPTDAGRVWVRNSRGELKRLDAHGRVALDQPAGAVVTTSLVQFHVESDRPLPSAPFDVPVEYRVRVGSGEAAATLTFTAHLRVDAAP